MVYQNDPYSVWCTKTVPTVYGVPEWSPKCVVYRNVPYCVPFLSLIGSEFYGALLPTKQDNPCKLWREGVGRGVAQPCRYTAKLQGTSARILSQPGLLHLARSVTAPKFTQDNLSVIYSRYNSALSDLITENKHGEGSFVK